MGSKCLWIAWSLVHERFTHRCRRLSLLTNSSFDRTFVKCQNYINSMWWCAYGGTYVRRKTIFLGRRWLRLTWPSGYPMYAKGRGWVSLSAKTKNDSSSQKPRCTRSILRKSPHRCSFKIWPPLLLGSWCLRLTRTPRYLNVPCRWRRLPLLAYSKVC